MSWIYVPSAILLGKSLAEWIFIVSFATCMYYLTEDLHLDRRKE